MAAIIAQLAAANRKRKQRRKATLPPEKSNLVLPPFDPCFDPRKHNRYLRLKALIEHRREVLATAREICEELQKDDEEWCYFMRYGKPRRNHEVPETAHGINDSAPPDELDPATLAAQLKKTPAEVEAAEKLRAKQARFWQIVNACISFISLSVFVSILLVLFFIFHNVDNKPWTSIFTNLFTDNDDIDKHQENSTWIT